MKSDYVITNDKIKPDLAGELGGVKIERRGKLRVVRMSTAQAKWFIEHGQIKALAVAPPPPPLAKPAQPMAGRRR